MEKEMLQSEQQEENTWNLELIYKMPVFQN